MLFRSSTDKWGVRVENVEIKEVDPASKVKDSMEEQTSAERKRRAAILEADGLKRAAIMEAEGKKKSMILEAEGKRMATILEAQGEAQKLRIMSVGAASMDAKALSVLSMDTIKAMGDGAASKIYFPMELTKLVDGISDYMGATRNVPDRAVSDTASIKEAVGEPDDILGPIPTPEDIRKETENSHKEVEKELEDTNVDNDQRLY